MGNSLLHIAQRITIDCESRGSVRHEDGETSIAASGIGDEPGDRLVHPPEGFAKLDKRVLIQMLMHGQMVEMVPFIIGIAVLRMDTVHLIVKLSQKMLGRHVTSKIVPTCFFPIRAGTRPMTSVDETYFLHAIGATLTERPQLDTGRLSSWLAQRHAKRQGTLVYIAV
jgi:hypothetical protein